MPRTTHYCLALLFCLSGTAHSQLNPPVVEDTIHILVLKEAGVSQTYTETQLNSLLNAWEDTSFTLGNAPVSLTVINAAAPLIMPDISSSAGYITHRNAVHALVSVPVGGALPIRDALAADIVLLFVDAFAGSNPYLTCGRADQDNWIPPPPSSGGQFDEDPLTGLDLNGKDDYYIALIANDVPCNGPGNTLVLAHEFGHLLGAGHYEVPAGVSAPRPGLLANSKAAWRSAGWGITRYTTIGMSPADSPCLSFWCIYDNVWSDWSFTWNDPQRRNTDAIDLTAESLAHYRMGTPTFGATETCIDGIDNDGDGQTDTGQDPDCSTGNSEVPLPPPLPPTCDATVRPFGLFTYLVDGCVPGTSTSHYRLAWGHHCPDQVFEYEIWAATPPTGLRTFRWVVPNTGSDAFITNGSGRIWVRSCGVGGCSGFTLNSVIVTDICP